MRTDYFSGDVNNNVSARNVYPTYPMASVGQRSSGGTPYTSGGYKAGNPGGNAAGASAQDAGSASVGGGGGAGPVGSGLLGKPLSWWVILTALLFVLMWAAKKYGGPAAEEFRSIKLSVYNIVVITVAAMIGRAALRVVFNTVQVPGLTPFVNAA